MSFSSDELRNDYNELLEELREIILNLKDYSADIHKKEEYEGILKELFDNFKRPTTYHHPFEIKEMVRIVNYPYQKTPLSIRGSEISNGRYHVIDGGPLCFYLSSSEETSLLETRVKQNEMILNKVMKSPKSIFFFNGILNNVLDMRLEEDCIKKGLSYELIFEDWQFLNTIYSLNSYTQRLAKRAFDYGYEGLLYPSTKNKLGYNLVVFIENLRVDSFISVIGDEVTLKDIDEKSRKISGYLPNIT